MDRENFIRMVKLAKLAERYEETVEAVKKVVTLVVELTVEERSFLFVGYNNMLGFKRALRTLSSIIQREEAKGRVRRLTVKKVKKLQQEVEFELSKICDDVIKVIDEHLVPYCTGHESSIFCYKMKEDYYRYMVEFKVDGERNEAVDYAMQAYQIASTKAEAELPPTHSIRLGLALSYILSSPERACLLAKKALDDAMSELGTSGESNKDSLLMVQLLRDNLTLWTRGHSQR